MKKRKWILPVCIVGGVIAVGILVLVIAAGYMISRGYGMTKGNLHVREDTVYLIEEGDSAIVLSDRSKGQNMFEGLENGDEVLVFHDGVEETYPARTGVYYVLRLAKGDKNFQPDNEVLGIFQINPDEENPLERMETYSFEAQYIRTDAYCEGPPYPDAWIIRSVEELQTYYEKNKEMFDLERRENPLSDSTIGFLDACEKYDAAFFEKQALLMVICEEGSGSIRHKVDSVGTVDSNLTVNIERLVPEAGTDDMAEWHIFIELPAEVKDFSREDVMIFIDGEDRTIRTD